MKQHIWPDWMGRDAMAIQIALAAVTTTAQVRAISSQQFAVGGVVQGPSHARGGVQLFHKSGVHVGEMEGEEIILTKGVYRNATRCC